MNGVSPAYLASLGFGLDGGVPNNTGFTVPGGAAPNASGYPALVPPPAPAPEPAAIPIGPPPAPAAPLAQAAPPPPPTAAAEPQVAPARPPPPPDFEYQPVAAPGTPAYEAHIRGPIQEGLIESSFEPSAEAANQIKLRSAMAAQREQDQYDIEAERVVKMQEARDVATARRDAEMRQLRMSYDSTIDDLSRKQLDPNRYWASQSTLEKIGHVALAFFGGLTGGTDGVVSRAIQDKIDADIKTQMFDYQKGLDTAKQKQTAFAMAMDQYGNEDAAYNASVASANQAAAMRISALKANWKGVEAQNQADSLIGELLGRAQLARAEGYRFMPATGGGVRYRAAIRGQVLPGTFSEKDVQGLSTKYGAEPSIRADEEMLKGGISAATERVKAGAKAAEKQDEGAKHIAQQLQVAGVPQAREAAEQALAALNKAPGSFGERAARAAVPGAIEKEVFPEDVNAREEAYQNFWNLTAKATMGNVTAQEEVRANRAMGGENHAARIRAVHRTLKILDAIEKNIKGGASVTAQEAHSEQEGSAKAGKPTAPEGVSKGW